MQKSVRIGLVGDFNSSVPAHQAIPLALHRTGDVLEIEVGFEWLPTDAVTSVAALTGLDGVWCVPASPYRNVDGALLAIQYAREQALPFLGTCGGFQHTILEYARNVLGWTDAKHGETAPDAARAVITLLECALLGATDTVRLFPGTHIAAAYGTTQVTEGYQCRYGLNPAFQSVLLAGSLRASAEDEKHEVRAV